MSSTENQYQALDKFKKHRIKPLSSIIYREIVQKVWQKTWRISIPKVPLRSLDSRCQPLTMAQVQGHNARIFPGRRRNCVGEGSVSIPFIMQSFHKFIVSLFCPIPPPMRAALCKLLEEVGSGARGHRIRSPLTQS